jgi:hypothetical protein
MLDLDSPAWGNLRASGGGRGARTAALLQRFRDGDDSELDELYHQVCHQNSVGEVAYPAVPHLVAMAANAPPPMRDRLIAVVGSVVASMSVF